LCIFDWEDKLRLLDHHAAVQEAPPVKKKSTLLAPLAAMALLLPTATTASAATQNVTGDWALDRIDQTALPLDGTYTTQSQGQGVNAYVIDSGIDYSNPDLGGRAHLAYDAFGGDGQPCTTPQTGFTDASHGTQVADVLGGTTYGVAKQVNLWSVKVMNCGDFTSSADTDKVIAAINWLAQNHQSPAVANISLSWSGAAYAELFDPFHVNELTAAVNNLAASGVFVTVAAGNVSSSDPLAFTKAYAVDNPPANAGKALVVMESDRNDQAPLNTTYTAADGCPGTWSSAFGGDIYAPGVAVQTDVDLNGPYHGLECGTSLAAPMAAGVAALYKATYGDTPSATLKSWILTHATQGAITNNPPQQGSNTNTYTPNLLLNTGGL
jgi:subtilisin family serine protease